MNKRLLVGMFIALMAMVPLSGYADQTIDAPHFNVDSNGGTEDCTYCHFANYQPSDCARCHSNNNAPYGDSTAPLVSTHKNLNCQACHNPHVSLQPTGITGSYTGILADTPSVGMTTLNGVTPTPDALWAAKTGPDRGLILWVANGTDAQGNPQSASFEVTAADPVASTVTVKGAVPVASGSFDLRLGQLIAKKVTKTAASSYRQGDLPVQFPSQGSGSVFIDTVNATPTGVCQVCHTTTQYWRNDGSRATHNANLPCTQCHKHASGFMVTGCTSCHPGPDPDGAPTVYPDQMALPSTGSQTAGQHIIHATPDGYNFPCGTCHYGTGMDRINDPTNIIKSDGIQIGFNWGKFMGYLTSYNGQASVTVPYDGTNHTKVTNTGVVGNGNMNCSNVYCHSDGTAVRRNCATSMPNTSPSWDGFSADPQGDSVKCNNCHGYRLGIANTIMSGSHSSHVGAYDFPCYNCHADTVADDGAGNVVLSNKSNHVNGSYEIKGGGLKDGNPIVVAYEKTTRKCSTATCHGLRVWRDSDAGTCPDPCVGITNDDPVIAPYAYPNDPINTADASQAYVFANDPNTLHIKIRATDPDNFDIVKNQCRKGADPTRPNFGGHYDQAGFIRTIFADQCNTFVYDAKFPNYGTLDKELTCRYSDAKLAATGGKMCWTYAVADNDPASYNNLVANGWTAPHTNLTDGIAAPNSAGVSPVEWACINPNINPAVVIDSPMNNVFPEVTKTVSVSGKQVSITFNVKDADQVDPAKQAYWQGIYPTKTGGHAANTNHYVQINWFNEALTKENSNPTNATALPLTATGGSKTYYYDFNTYTGTSDGVAATTTSGMLNPVGTGKARNNVWVQAYICDNHVLGAEGLMNKDCYDTGWFQVMF